MVDTTANLIKDAQKPAGTPRGLVGGVVPTPVENLSKGLRPSSRFPRNNGFLTTCDGMVGRDGVLSSLDQLTRLSIAPMEVIGSDAANYTCILSHTAAATNYPVTGVDYATYWSQTGEDGAAWASGTAYSKGIDDGFPYPCQFVFNKMTIICGETDIFELVAGALAWKLTVTAGTTWRALDFHDFIYLSNGKVSVTRDPSTKLYSISDQPVASAMCNFNGQAILGAPGVSV